MIAKKMTIKHWMDTKNGRLLSIEYPMIRILLVEEKSDRIPEAIVANAGALIPPPVDRALLPIKNEGISKKSRDISIGLIIIPVPREKTPKDIASSMLLSSHRLLMKKYNMAVIMIENRYHGVPILVVKLKICFVFSLIIIHWVNSYKRRNPAPPTKDKMMLKSSDH